jgi:hypothetical protein
MVDTSPKIAQIITKFIDPGEYFVINRARQYGKTTTMQLLEGALSDECLVLKTSFEASEDIFASRKVLAEEFSFILSRTVRKRNPANAGIADMLASPMSSNNRLEELAIRITALCKQAGKPVILMIDEVDRASDYDVFISLLGLFRRMYLDRRANGRDSTFHSVVLAGVHDIKNLKAKIRPDSEHAYNSPWNIAAAFDVDLGFAPGEIATMLTEYEADHQTGMDILVVSKRLHHHTSGYPFLVSALCKLIDEGGMAWDGQGVDQAAGEILLQTNTLFDDVIKNIQDHEGLADMVRDMLVRGKSVTYVPSDPDLSLGLMYGVFKREGQKVAVSNRIFEAYIYEYLIAMEQKKSRIPSTGEDQSGYVEGGRLDMGKVLDRFAQFMHREYRREAGSLVEAQGRLLFLAYLRPVINGAGHYFVEAETRANTRMDVVVAYGKEVFIVELKIWHGKSHERDAIGQLAGYVQSQGQAKGYLVSFCDLKKAPRAGGVFQHAGVEIHESIVAYKDEP